jgi:hypothetical protein
MDVMLSESEASAFPMERPSRFFGGVYPERDEGPENDIRLGFDSDLNQFSKEAQSSQSSEKFSTKPLLSANSVAAVPR